MKKDLKTCFFSWPRSGLLSIFLGQVLVFCHFFRSTSCFLSFLLGWVHFSFFFSWMLSFFYWSLSWSKACFLSYSLGFFFINSHLRALPSVSCPCAPWELSVLGIFCRIHHMANRFSRRAHWNTRSKINYPSDGYPADAQSCHPNLSHQSDG